MNNLGQHYMVDVVGVDEAKIDSEEFIQRIITEACEACGATLLNVSFHKFDPQGLTMLALLAESHISYHSFPEKNGSVAIDIYTCGDVDAKIAVDYLLDKLSPVRYTVHYQDRGRMT